MALAGRASYLAEMAAAQNLASLGKLVARHHGWAAAKAFKTYQMGDADRAKLTSSALEILRVFPNIPGACALMSAALAVRLEKVLDGPVHVVAGTLTVENVPVFGKRSNPPMDAFSEGKLDRDGHVWLMVGPYVADISIFRTAYSSFGPAALSRHIDLVFGPNQALYVDEWKRTRQRGLGYEPHYVLSEPEVTGLMHGAFEKIRAHHRSSATG